MDIVKLSADLQAHVKTAMAEIQTEAARLQAGIDAEVKKATEQDKRIAQLEKELAEARGSVKTAPKPAVEPVIHTPPHTTVHHGAATKKHE